MTNTLSLQIPAKLYALLKAHAEKTSQTPEQVATELLTSCLSQSSGDPLESWIGSIDSQSSDWATDHDKHLGAVLQ
jgi:protein involved in temperature-dependent protein secretion